MPGMIRCRISGYANSSGCLHGKAAIRMADKWSRFVSLMGKDGPEVKGETIDDTLKDLAVYAVIVKVLREEAEGA